MDFILFGPRLYSACPNMGLGLWRLMPLSTIFQPHRGGQFIGRGNWSTRRKPLTCRTSSMSRNGDTNLRVYTNN